MKDIANNIFDLVFEDFLCVTFFIMSIVFTSIFATSLTLPVDTGMLTEVSGIISSVSMAILAIAIKVNQYMTRKYPIHF